MQFREEMLHCYLVGGTQDVNHDPKRFLNDVSIAMDSGITAKKVPANSTKNSAGS